MLTRLSISATRRLMRRRRCRCWLQRGRASQPHRVRCPGTPRHTCLHYNTIRLDPSQQSFVRLWSNNWTRPLRALLWPLLCNLHATNQRTTISVQYAPSWKRLHEWPRRLIPSTFSGWAPGFWLSPCLRAPLGRYNRCESMSARCSRPDSACRACLPALYCNEATTSRNERRRQSRSVAIQRVPTVTMPSGGTGVWGAQAVARVVSYRARAATSLAWTICALALPTMPQIT